jgi:integrase
MVDPRRTHEEGQAALVPLSRQAMAMFEELKGWRAVPNGFSRAAASLHQPIAHSTLNVAVRALDFDVRDFVIHDFRRTASTHLHEAGFNSDWIEKALAHETKGIRGVYNRAQYAGPTAGNAAMVG